MVRIRKICGSQLLYDFLPLISWAKKTWLVYGALRFGYIAAHTASWLPGEDQETVYVEEDENFGDFAPYDVSPERFLNLLRNAEYVCTDSFHGTAFSILNEKQFVVFNRYAENSSFSKNSRIDTLCVNFGLESRRYKNGMDLSDVVKDDIDYKAVGEKYKNLKLVTDEYLNTILREIKGRA